MKIFFPILSLLLLGAAVAVPAQGSLIPRGNPTYGIMDRLEIRSGLAAPYHTSVRQWERGPIVQYALRLDSTLAQRSKVDDDDLRFIFLDNNEWLGQAAIATSLTGRRIPPCPDTMATMVTASLEHPNYFRSKKPWLNFFYPTPAHLLEVNEPAFFLRVNPLLNLQYGALANENQPYFINQRGFELWGGIDDRIYVYFNLLENQTNFPSYVRERFSRYRSLPGAGLVKGYQNEALNITTGNDFLLSDGGVGFNLSPHVGAQIGYGRNFIGNGYRSLLLSDFAFNAIYLKMNWKIWKFHFQNIFSELLATAPRGNQLATKKFMAAHHLSINLRPNLNVGVFETVVFSRVDHFEFQYLNPVILYRTVEGALGSPDNILLGFDAKWNFGGHFQLYGQLLLDEFVYRELIRNPRGWWANKYAYQVGVKYVNALGIDHLDLQLEANVARPYTYAHFDSLASSYAHLQQPLAHPLGANFKEWVFQARYQPWPRLVLDFRVLRATFGEDPAQQNWGGDVNRANYTYEREFGNTIGQGIKATSTIVGVDLSYRLAHQIFADLQFFQREKISAEARRNQNDRYLSLGLRVNMGKLRMDF